MNTGRDLSCFVVFWFRLILLWSIGITSMEPGQFQDCHNSDEATLDIMGN